MTIPLPSPDRQPRPMARPGWTDFTLSLQEALGGRYVIERELGRGGMGIVFLAHETALERPVALKLLPPAKVTQQNRERFMREARMAARLVHQHIVPIHAVEEAGNFIYFTMEYIRGRTLFERIREEGPLSAGETARILREVAWAVEYAHRHDIIHRDLKPSNILLDESGRAMVTDFGLAKVTTDVPLPGSGRTFGTASYISPERAVGLPADARSDIYSLGMAGYHAATGELPFTGSVTEILEQHITVAAPQLRVFSEHLDMTLSRVVARCLAKDPDERFQTAADLATALSEVPELRRDLPVPLQAFLHRVHYIARLMPIGAPVGVSGSWAAAGALVDGLGRHALLAAGFLGLASTGPLFALLPVVRRMIPKGHTRADINHALRVDLERQREAIAYATGRPRPPAGRTARRLALAGGTLFGCGVLLAVSGLDLPVGLVMGISLVGALTAALVGLVVWVQDWLRGQLVGDRWLRFWSSRAGTWAMRVAAFSLDTNSRKRAPSARLQIVRDFPVPVAALSAELRELIRLTSSRLRHIRAWLAASSSSNHVSAEERLETESALRRNAEALETLVAQFVGEDVSTVDPGSVTDALNKARAICEVIDQLLETNRIPGDGA